MEVLASAVPGEEPLLLADAAGVFPGDWAEFESGAFQRLRTAGLVLL
jgi:hypothetical protein